MRTRVKIIQDRDAATLSKMVNEFLSTIDETAEIVSIATHTNVVAGSNSRIFERVTTTVVYKEITGYFP